jgi:protein disulfide-isomerase
LAKKYNLANDLEELLFKAYLTEGKDINDLDTLSKLGIEVGLDAEAIAQVLNSDTYGTEVQKDQEEANAIGVQGVPFFVLDNKYAISGAQPASAFLETLEKVWQEGKFEIKPTLLNTTDGESCGIDGCN